MVTSWLNPKYFITFLNTDSHKGWGHTNKMPIGYDWAPRGHESRYGLPWNTMAVFFLHLVKEQMSWEAIDMDKPHIKSYDNE